MGNEFPVWFSCFLRSLAVPCEPSGLSVDLDCETGSATLSWDVSEGAVEYFGFAQSQGGEMLYCNSTDISCTIDGLECGETFNFSVEASDGVCNSSFSEPVELGAGKSSVTETTIMMQKVYALLNYRGIVPEWK